MNQNEHTTPLIGSDGSSSLSLPGWRLPARLVWTLGAVLSLGIFGGCAVGPQYHRPAVSAPDTFRGETSAATNSLADLPWWDLYQDEILRNLIRQALTNNHDVRLALARVEHASAIAAQARAAFFPQIDYAGGAGRGQHSFLGTPVSGSSENGNPEKSSFLAVFNAAWEVDLFGRVRRGSEIARAQYLATEEARRGVTVALLGRVATAYFQLIELDQVFEIAQRTTNSFGEILRIFNERLQGGVASKLETSRTEAALASAAATIPELHRRILLKENELSVLLGRNPGPIPRATSSDLRPPDVPAGLPSALLERRPDLREAEQDLRAANAMIGLALGQFFPRIGLTTFYGRVSAELSALTSGAANDWAVAATATGPIFQGGRLYGQYRQARAAWEAASLRYQQTALSAFHEVSDALLSREQLAKIRLEQERAVRAYEDSVAVSLQRYRAGKASYYEVLESQQLLFPAETALARTRLNQLLVTVQLYAVLGGGWQLGETEGQ